jgi:O-antigen ligase
VAKLISIAESNDLNSLTAGRAHVIDEVFSSFDIDTLFVFFGSGFRVDVGELGTPHNQYVEWFLRGGLIFAITNIAILCWSIYRHFSIGGRTHYLAGVVLLSVLLISNNINTPFRVPYTSVFLWFLIGLSFVPYHSYFRPGRNFTIRAPKNRN